jgi:putative protease
MSAKEIGKVTHFFGHVSVAVLALSGKISVGDTLHFMGHSTDFKQLVDSMQIEHKDVKSAKKGDDVAVKVNQRVHENDKVFRLTAED